ncbi:MAG: hypothetical protein RLZZ546_1813 [Bacteroidota bacterium]|jgi:choline monooxygenase
MSSFFVHEEIAKASTIDKSVYLSEEVFEKMKNKIFPKTWQYIGDKTQLQNHGDCMPFAFIEGFIDEPMLAVNKDDYFYCLSNVCTHRGNLLIKEACNQKNGITCKYHGKRFDVDGTFKFMPEFKEVENFPTEADNLENYQMQSWGNWLFTSINPIQSFEKYMSPMLERLHWLSLEEFKLKRELNKEYSVNANWALYCENYLEGFHIPFVHQELNSKIDYGTYETISDKEIILQIGYAKNDELSFDLPKDSIDYGKKIAAYYFWVFPNLMFNFYPWGLSLNIVKPISINKTIVSYITFISNENLYNQGAGSGLDKVEMEDEEIVESVQKGIESSKYKHGRYSATREQGTHHFHRLLAAYLNE